ncbi:MAG TPA: two-component system response regulator [Flavobacteriales bacterium]|nr:two-component system response regulator [Flavobacteriales bacterium]
MNGNKPILLVEDDEVDIMTVQRALKEVKVMNPLEFTNNGEEALEYLNNPLKRRPCVILLDINMPRMNGIEFLREREKDLDLRTIPVVVLTSSREEQDLLQSYELGISGYMIKPVDYKQFVETIRVIDLYWTLSQFPSTNPSHE